MNSVKKVKLMLAVEYTIFVLVFLVLGILFLTNVIGVADWKRYVFTYLTLVVGIWMIVDMIWTIRSPNRRKKNSLLDKIIVVPGAAAIMVFDVYAIARNCSETLPYNYVIGSYFCYLAALYLFMTIYHWFKPIPGVIEAALEDEKKDEAK